MKKQENFITREEKTIIKKQKTYAQKYPLLFALGGAFGLVATFYGFEKIIDRFDIFTENPAILLAVGLTLLILTGTFYNKLQ